MQALPVGPCREILLIEGVPRAKRSLPVVEGSLMGKLRLAHGTLSARPQ
jgi:hypothetical protein